MKHASLLKCIAVGYQPLHHCWKPTLEIVVLEYMVRWRFQFFYTIFGKAIQFDEWLNHQLESARKIVYPFWSLTKDCKILAYFFGQRHISNLKPTTTASMVFEQLAQRGLLSSFFEQLLVQHLKKHGRCQVLGVVQATEWCCPPPN